MKLETNYFKLFGCPLQFSVDLIELKKVFRQLQRQYHPDRHARSTPQEQRLAVQFSAHLNTANTVMENPVLRALHLLSLLGVAVDHQNSTIKDTVFLIEQMELREDLADAKETSDRLVLQRLLAEVTRLFDNCQQQFSSIISSYLVSESSLEGGSSKQPQAVLELEETDQLISLAGKMQFYEKLLAETTLACRRLGE